MFARLPQDTRRAAGSAGNAASHRFPWFREQFRIVYRDVVLQGIAFAGEALYHVQSVTVEIAVSVQPGLGIDGDDIHDERIPIPGRDGVTQRHRIEILTVLRANRYNSEGMGLIFVTLI